MILLRLGLYLPGRLVRENLFEEAFQSGDFPEAALKGKSHEQEQLYSDIIGIDEN